MSIAAPEPFLDERKSLACVHCGLCLSACPTYLETGNENDSPRGRIYLMRALQSGRSPLSDVAVRHIDLCLGCRACEVACPSGVQYGDLLESTREHIEKRYRRSTFQTFLRRIAIEKVFPFPGRTKLALLPARIILALHAESFLPKFAREALALIPERSKEGMLPVMSSGKSPSKGRVGFIRGCVMNVLFGDTNEASVRLLNKMGFDVVTPPEQICCGALYAHGGNLDEARACARRNIEAFEKHELDAIIINAAGCGSTLKEYGHLLSDDRDWAQRGEAFSAKVKDLTEVLEKSETQSPKSKVVTYHDACHLCHAQRITKPPRDLLKAVTGDNFVELPESDVCCGSAGSYNLTEPEMAERLQRRKIENILKTGAEVVVTTNPGCILQIRAGLKKAGATQIEVLHIADFPGTAMKQPLVAVALCYGAGVIVGHFIEAPILAAFIITLILAFVALFLSFARPLFLPLLLFLFGWLNMSTREAIISPFDLRSMIHDRAQLITVRGRLAESPAQRVITRNEMETFQTRAEIEVSEVRLPRGDWQPAAGWVMSRTPGMLSSNCFAGQTVEVAGIALDPPQPIAEGVFDYRRYLRLRRIYYEFKIESARDWKTIGHDSPPLADKFRAWGQRTLARGLPEQDESLRLQWAMLLGWQTALTAEVSEPFMRSGTMHIFAISGLHIALIAGIFVALLRAVLVPRELCGLIVIPLLWFYTAATGWQASAIRSTVMMTIIIAGWSLKRPVNLLNSLAMAACIILVWQPEQLFQAGFQLSFFVVLSIAVLTPPIENLRQKVFALDPLLPLDLRPRWQRVGIRMGGTFWTFLATSLAALLGSAPLIAYYFHLVTPGSLFANLVVVPVSSLALVSGLGAMVTSEFLPTITELFNHSGWFWMRSMIFLSERAADLPGAWFHVRSPAFGVFIIYYGLLIAFCAGWLKRPAMRWVTIVSACVLATGCFFTWKRERSWHRITTLPLNGGHAVYVEPRGASEWLIDCGNKSAIDFTLKPFLQAHGENRLANLLLTQGDARQIGGVSRLHEVFPVQQAFSSPVPSRSSPYREALSELEVKSKLCRCATNGFKSTPWTVLHPESTDRFASAGDNAVVTLGTFDGVRVLLVPNLSKGGQNAIVTRHPQLTADIVIAGLPNTGEPLVSDWLSVLRPKLVIIADSELPTTRRASPDLARRISKSGATVLFTRQSGAITLAIRDGKWNVKSARTGNAAEMEF